MPESTLMTLRTLLGIPDDSRDALLTTIVSAVQARLLLLLGGASEVPESLAYIVPEVAVIRYNRIGSEGMSSHSVEGETVAYADNDFAGYMGEIEAYLDEQQTTNLGSVRFLVGTIRQSIFRGLPLAHTTRKPGTMAATPSRRLPDTPPSWTPARRPCSWCTARSSRAA